MEGFPSKKNYMYYVNYICTHAAYLAYLGGNSPHAQQTVMGGYGLGATTTSDILRKYIYRKGWFDIQGHASE
jgi:hypothetical protein